MAELNIKYVVIRESELRDMKQRTINLSNRLINLNERTTKLEAPAELRFTQSECRIIDAGFYDKLSERITNPEQLTVIIPSTMVHQWICDLLNTVYEYGETMTALHAAIESGIIYKLASCWEAFPHKNGKRLGVVWQKGCNANVTVLYPKTEA